MAAREANRAKAKAENQRSKAGKKPTGGDLFRKSLKSTMVDAEIAMSQGDWEDVGNDENVINLGHEIIKLDFDDNSESTYE